MPTLRPPTVDENLWSRHRFWSRYVLPRGIALLVLGPVVTEAQYPYQDDLDGYDAVYLGGHVYEITDAEAAVLIAAGYGANIS